MIDGQLLKSDNEGVEPELSLKSGCGFGDTGTLSLKSGNESSSTGELSLKSGNDSVNAGFYHPRPCGMIKPK